MHLPDNYILIQREVKHARLRVSEDGNIRVIIPQAFTQEEVNTLITKKQRWIDKHLKFFANMSKINMQRNQILLYGNRYTYFYDSKYEHRIIVDHDHKIIKAKKNLLDRLIQQSWYTGLAKKYLTKRTAELAKNLNLKYNRLYIRNQSKKWGNCSQKKNISLNWRLIKAPPFVIDYIIIHELVHTVVMNHTHKFWVFLKSLYPASKDAMDWLEKYGNSL